VDDGQTKMCQQAFELNHSVDIPIEMWYSLGLEDHGTTRSWHATDDGLCCLETLIPFRNSPYQRST
jgi:hypothetical protein